jgi:hypothetical protein
MRTRLLLGLGALALALVSCSLTAGAPTNTPPATIVSSTIDRHPAPPACPLKALSVLPAYNLTLNDPYQVDLSSADLSRLDLRQSADDLQYADFDSRTRWPSDAMMPAGFDWKQIMDLGTNPGLGILTVHAHGITGRGVNIAIVDQPLLVEHQEYASRLRLYEEINVDPHVPAQMHGPAVASIAVGETVGVAPEANLYYIATWAFDPATRSTNKRDFRFYAQAVRRILEINRQLPEGQRIRVVSTSVGWGPDEAGYDEITAAVEAAKAEGIFVTFSSLEQTYGFKMQGLGRDPLADPDRFESYEPGLFWAKQLPSGGITDRLLIPMDSRTVASPCGVDEYAFFRPGGWSWITPYIAGVYALSVQVDPSITPERFWSLAMATGRTIELERDGKPVPFGPIVDPVALIKALDKGQAGW